MKLWQLDGNHDEEIHEFTTGKDHEMDLYLAPYDVIGSMAHVIMLGEAGLITPEESEKLHSGLAGILHHIEAGEFIIEPTVEDVHSQIEMILTKRLGDLGKKVHTGRSRNDQVLTAIKLFTRDGISTIFSETSVLVNLLIRQSEKFKSFFMPGYTHFQVAMPSSFGLWFSSFAESLVDDMLLLATAFEFTDKNPLGSAAGYGSSFHINRERTTELLGFSDMNVNVIYAQATRGKTEKIVLSSMASVASTLSRMTSDICLYMGKEYQFFQFPDRFTTGSSIMPHKRNPDVFELIRAKSNLIQALPFQLGMIQANLPTGYHRDLQITKEIYLPAFEDLRSCISLLSSAIKEVKIKENIDKDPSYNEIYSVDQVNRLVMEGKSFRDAYHEVAGKLKNSKISNQEGIPHTHTGSKDNLSNHLIQGRMERLIQQYDMKSYQLAIEKLKLFFEQ